MSTDQLVHRKRPIFVWLISLYFIVGAIWSLLSFHLLWSGALPLDPAQKAYFDRLTPIDHALTIIILLLNVTAAITFFLLLKISRYLFLSAVGLILIQFGSGAASKGLGDALGASGSAGTLFGLLLLIAACIYAWYLGAKGVLH